MQIKDVRPESFVKQVRCDCCGNLSELGEVEFHESVSIDFKAGYGSIFGDGNDVQVDLCQHCLKATLGPWLRISDAASRHAVFEQRLFRFSPDQHGGEKPTAADGSMQAPEDLPAQQPPVLSVPLGIQQRLAPAWRFIGYSVRLFFAPLTGSIRGIRQEYQRLARTEHAYRRRQPLSKAAGGSGRD